MTSSTALLVELTTWFPLLPRPRPTCRDLTDRVEEVSTLTDPDRHESREDAVAAAAEAFNKTALIYSDCGLRKDAERCCWRQFALFQAHAPLTMRSAKFALQPLVNLARLHIRASQGDRAYALLNGLNEGLRSGKPAILDGQEVDLVALLDSNDPAPGRRELLRFAWTVLLADGTRALTRAGRWNDALEHIQAHRGIGKRLLDGRQVAIITHVVNGNHDRALDLLHRSSVPQPWEKSIRACLNTLCRTLAGQDTRTSETAMSDHFLALAQQPTPPAFHCRLGLCVLDLAEHAPRALITAEIARHVIQSRDAHAARDALAHPSCRDHMSTVDLRELTSIIAAASLGGTTPSDIVEALRKLETAGETSLTNALSSCQ